MNPRTLALAACLLLAACSKVTQENFAAVKNGMTEQEVAALLGTPDETSSVQVMGVSGTASRWTGKDVTVTVRFVNGKVAIKSLERLPGR